MSEALKERKVGLFDFIRSLGESKENLFDEDTQTVYNPFMVCRAFGQHIDTVMYANEMNKRPDSPKVMHHDFFFYGVEARKRYGKWAKEEKTNEAVIEYLKETYSINNDRALEYLSLLSDDEVKAIETRLKSKVNKR